jgi:hypothetical protein
MKAINALFSLLMKINVLLDVWQQLGAGDSIIYEMVQ